MFNPEKKHLSSKLKSGFTLIELLVVIAIIALLAAILFPVFGRARDKARQSACLSNLKQMGLAMMQYTQDFDERMPPGKGWADVPGRAWVPQVFPYFKSINVMVCPSDTGGGAMKGWSYGYNVNAAGYNNPEKVTGFDYYYGTDRSLGAPRTVADFNSPAKTALFFEITELNFTHNADPLKDTNSAAGNGHPWQTAFSTNQQFYATGQLAGDETTPPPALVRDKFGRHNSGAAYLMADGHAKWMMPKSVSGGRSPDASDYCAYPEDTRASGTDCAKVNVTFSLK